MGGFDLGIFLLTEKDTSIYRWFFWQKTLQLVRGFSIQQQCLVAKGWMTMNYSLVMTERLRIENSPFVIGPNLIDKSLNYMGHFP